MSKNKESKPKIENKAGLDWNRCVEYHKYLAEWYQFAPWEGVMERDLLDFAMYGDLVSQSYLCGLRKALPADAKTVQMPHYFETLLLAHIQRMNEMLCDLAREGRRGACSELWNQALKLNQAFCELALKNPAPFKPHARRSLFMPSIRTKNPKFTADAKAIAEVIELSAETVGDNVKDNRTRIGALTARLVGECVHEIKRSRSLWENLFTPYGLPVIWPTFEQIKPFLNKSNDKLIKGGRGKVGPEKNDKEKMDSHLRFFSMLADCGVDRLHFLLLPELTTKTAPAWWKEAIEKMIDSKSPALLQQPALVKELKKLPGVSTKTEMGMLRELKRRCVGKVKHFALHCH